MSNEMNIQEIITELDKIDTLCGKIVDISEKSDNLVSVQNPKKMKESTQKTIKILEDYQEDQEKKLAGATSKLQIKLPQPPTRPRKPKHKRHGLAIFRSAFLAIFKPLAIVLTILLWIITLTSSNIAVTMFGIFIGIGLIYFIIVHLLPKDPYEEYCINHCDYRELCDEIEEWDSLLKNWEKEFDKTYSNETRKEVYHKFIEYDKQFLSLVETCDKKFDEETAKYKEELERIEEENRKELHALCQEREALVDELKSITLIPEDLYVDAWRISSMLKHRRADSLKEAINLALEEKRKEGEEDARREEAARREAILEQQAYDNRMHNEIMQRAAEEEVRATREHNIAMERVAQAQVKEAEKQAKMITEQARNTELAAKARCRTCANSNCRIAFGPGSIGCPSYRPR